MSRQSSRPSWDHDIGIVLAVLGGFILLVKLKIHTLVLSLWPVALIVLGWKMYRRAGEQSPRDHRPSPPPPPAEEDEDLPD